MASNPYANDSSESDDDDRPVDRGGRSKHALPRKRPHSEIVEIVHNQHDCMYDRDAASASESESEEECSSSALNEWSSEVHPVQPVRPIPIPRASTGARSPPLKSPTPPTSVPPFKTTEKPLPEPLVVEPPAPEPLVVEPPAPEPLVVEPPKSTPSKVPKKLTTTSTTSTTTPPKPTTKSTRSAILWSEKYRPSSFSHLLSNKKAIEGLRKWVADRKASKANTAYAALVHGPPGVGKTTAVNLVLRSAGYQVYEINASDVRTRTALKNEITKAARFRSPFGKKSAVVVEEVDGAVSNTGGKKEDNEAKDSQDKAGGANSGVRGVIEFIKQCKHEEAKSSGAIPSVTPIVCVANSTSASAMRTLENNCKTFRFYHAWGPKEMLPLVNRVCKGEALKLTEADKMTLATAANGDYRRLMNLLQLSACQEIPLRAPNSRCSQVRSVVQTSAADVYSDIFAAAQEALCGVKMTRGRLESLLNCDPFMMRLMIQHNAPLVIDAVPESAFEDGNPGKESACLFDDAPKSTSRVLKYDALSAAARCAEAASDADIMGGLYGFECDEESKYVMGFGARFHTRKIRPFVPRGRFGRGMRMEFPSFLSKFGTIRAARAARSVLLAHLTGSTYTHVESTEVLQLLREKLMSVRGAKREALMKEFPEFTPEDWELVKSKGKRPTKRAKTSNAE